VSAVRVQLAVFRVGEQTYALDIMRIKEVINPLPITPVPKAPATLEGVIELRKQILPVVDLRKRFDRPPTPTTSASKIILVKLEQGIVGLMVDGVREVVRLPREEIRPAPSLGAQPDAAFFTGVCRLGDDIVMVLDIDRVLSSEERISLAGLEEVLR
jgi:purine-binding chemotaxis protein CheW